MYSFPYSMPISSNTMNYVAAVHGVVIAIIGTDRVARGLRCHKGASERHVEALQVMEATGVMVVEANEVTSPVI